MTVIYLGRK